MSEPTTTRRELTLAEAIALAMARQAEREARLVALEDLERAVRCQVTHRNRNECGKVDTALARLDALPPAGKLSIGDVLSALAGSEAGRRVLAALESARELAHGTLRDYGPLALPPGHEDETAEDARIRAAWGVLALPALAEAAAPGGEGEQR